jgi:hypothetical protein
MDDTTDDVALSAEGGYCGWCGKRVVLEPGETDVSMRRELAALRAALERLLAEETNPTKLAIAAARIVSSISATMRAGREFEKQARLQAAETFVHWFQTMDDEHEREHDEAAGEPRPTPSPAQPWVRALEAWDSGLEDEDLEDRR